MNDQVKKPLSFSDIIKVEIKGVGVVTKKEAKAENKEVKKTN